MTAPAVTVSQAPWDRLGALPRSTWQMALTAATPDPAARLADAERWLMALAQGELPPPDAHFGDPVAAAALRTEAQSVGVPRHCAGRPVRAEEALRLLLWHLDRLIDLQPRCTRAEALEAVAHEFRAAWSQEQGEWDRLQALMPDAGPLANLTLDARRGLLARRGWAEAEALSLRLHSMPELVALIRQLGRRTGRSPRPAAVPRARPMAPRRASGRWVETRLPGLPGELRGLCLTARLEAQTAGEAAMLRHPVLGKLWRARFAEGRLLGHDQEATLVDWRPDPAARAAAPSAAAPTPAPERGPMLLCLDTSGSMRGAPEVVAKAVALEAARTAWREGRGCRLLAFGGAGELIEHTLGPDEAGLHALMDLLEQSFDGGTDLQTPLDRAVESVHGAGWHEADLLLVSDGEFGCTPAALRRLDAARDRFGLRVQGVLVGDRETLGLLEVADAVHWLRDWRRHGASSEEGTAAARGFSPVHSRSLTALYFPNALSERAARHRR